MCESKVLLACRRSEVFDSYLGSHAKVFCHETGLAVLRVLALTRNTYKNPAKAETVCPEIRVFCRTSLQVCELLLDEYHPLVQDGPRILCQTCTLLVTRSWQEAPSVRKLCPRLVAVCVESSGHVNSFEAILRSGHAQDGYMETFADAKNDELAVPKSDSPCQDGIRRRPG